MRLSLCGVIVIGQGKALPQVHAARGRSLCHVGELVPQQVVARGRAGRILPVGEEHVVPDRDRSSLQVVRHAGSTRVGVNASTARVLVRHRGSRCVSEQRWTECGRGGLSRLTHAL